MISDSCLNLVTFAAAFRCDASVMQNILWQLLRFVTWETLPVWLLLQTVLWEMEHLLDCMPHTSFLLSLICLLLAPARLCSVVEGNFHAPWKKENLEFKLLDSMPLFQIRNESMRHATGHGWQWRLGQNSSLPSNTEKSWPRRKRRTQPDLVNYDYVSVSPQTGVASILSGFEIPELWKSWVSGWAVHFKPVAVKKHLHETGWHFTSALTCYISWSWAWLQRALYS